MNNKDKFGEYIKQKRLEADLTQKEFAERLFVSDKTVSKWERGISYPDITLISKICKELNITEHEFITACDDMVSRKEKLQARRFRNFVKGYHWTLIILYSIALITSFIVNLAVNHTLTWFFVVLASFALAFSITNLPIMLKKQKTLITFAIATVLIYFLLFVISVYTSADWLFKVAYPIATLPVLAVWLIMLTIRYLRENWFLKSGIITLVLAFLTITIVPFLEYLTGEGTVVISDYFKTANLQGELMEFIILFWALAFWSIIGIITGLIKMIIRRRQVTE